MTGEKRELLVIRKSKKPRCFRGVSLPVRYDANRSAWMTASIFKLWLLEWDMEMDGSAKRNIRLLIDNCTAHPSEAAKGGTNIRLEFLTANTTSVLQPLGYNAGIIKAVKAHYHHSISQRVLSSMEEETRATPVDVAKKVTLLQGAWGDVTTSSVQNCLEKAALTVVDDNYNNSGSNWSNSSSGFCNNTYGYSHHHPMKVLCVLP